MAKLDCYMYVINGVKYDMPFMECIQSVLPVADAVHVITDPRFADGTYERLSQILDKRVHLHPIQMDLDNPAVDGATKEEGRKRCDAPLLIQMDCDETIREQDIPKIRQLKDNWPRNITIIGTGVINWFNGPHIKLSAAGAVKERFTRSNAMIQHGIPMSLRIPIDGTDYYKAQKRSTDGAGLIDEVGNPLVPQLLLAKGDNPIKDIDNPDSIWVHHWSWYSLPRKWEMKQTWHYFWGLLWGEYPNLKAYKIDKDGEPVDFFGKNFRKPNKSYLEPIRDEMQDKSIARANGIDIPHYMKSWVDRQRIYIPKTWKKWPPQLTEYKQNMEEASYSFSKADGGMDASNN